MIVLNNNINGVFYTKFVIDALTPCGRKWSSSKRQLFLHGVVSLLRATKKGFLALRVVYSNRGKTAQRSLSDVSRQETLAEYGML